MASLAGKLSTAKYLENKVIQNQTNTDESKTVPRLFLNFAEAFL